MMKKFKALTFAIILVISGFILGACGSNIYAANSIEGTFRYKNTYETNGGMLEVLEYIDQETGVNYIVIGSWNQYHVRYEGITITPKLNTDGSLYITQ